MSRMTMRRFCTLVVGRYLYENKLEKVCSLLMYVQKCFVYKNQVGSSKYKQFKDCVRNASLSSVLYQTAIGINKL